MSIKIRNAQPIRFAITENWTNGIGTYDLHAESPDRFVIEDLGSEKIARFTVNAGDQVGTSSGERAEIVLGRWDGSTRFLITGMEKEIEYYRFGVKLSAPWLAPTANGGGYQWGICFQAHGPNEFMTSPAISLHVEDVFKLFVFGGDVDLQQGGFVPVKNNAISDAWVDFVIEVKWATDNTGAVALYRKDESQIDFGLMGSISGIPTLQWKGVEKRHPHYWKTGFYRSESNHTNTIHISQINRTTKRDIAFS